MDAGKSIFLNVDYLDLCDALWQRNQWLYGRDDIQRLADRAAAHGVDAVLWRVSYIGRAGYYSRVEDRAGWAPGSWGALAKVMDQFDPLQVAAEAFHQRGIACYPWMTLFDDFSDYFPSRLCRLHPEFQWADRSGSIFCPGVLSLAWPEVFAHKLAMVCELAAYPVDGLFLCMRSHSAAFCPYRQTDFFGYEEPIRQEFQKRYGQDIRHCDAVRRIKDQNSFVANYEYRGGEFDRNAWHRLKGEYLTRFLRESRGALAPTGRKLIFNANQILQGPRDFARLHHDYALWSQDRIIDALGVTQWLQQADGTAPVEGVADWDGHVLLWVNVETQPGCWDAIDEYRRIAAALPGVDGLLLHEAASFEFGLRVPGPTLALLRQPAPAG